MHAAVTNVTAAWARSTWTWSCDLWPVWVRVSAPFKHYTNSPAVHLKYPAHLSGQGTETWMFEVIYTEQLDSPASHIFSPDASLWSSVTPRQAALSNVVHAGLSLTGCSKSHSIAWIHGLHCMVLHLQTCLDCNTGHTECSTCCVPRLGARNPTNTTTATVKHAEVPNGNYNTDTSRINERNQGKYLIIYLNSQVLNLCLYTVNSATLHRKRVSKSWETSSVKLNNLCYF